MHARHVVRAKQLSAWNRPWTRPGRILRSPCELVAYVHPSIHPSVHPSVCPATQHHQHFEAQGRETPTEIKVRLPIFVCKVGMSDHGTWKRNFAEVVRVAHAADCKYDDLEMKLSGNGPWDLGVAGLTACPRALGGFCLLRQLKALCLVHRGQLRLLVSAHRLPGLCSLRPGPASRLLAGLRPAGAVSASGAAEPRRPHVFRECRKA
eukprot:s2628_g12.t1